MGTVKQKANGTPAKPVGFSKIALYSNRELLERRLKEGFSEVAFGAGPWVKGGDERIVSIAVFYKKESPGKNIATYEHYKITTPDMHIMSRGPLELEYTSEQFEKHQNQYKLKMGPKTDLAELLRLWTKE